MGVWDDLAFIDLCQAKEEGNVTPQQGQEVQRLVQLEVYLLLRTELCTALGIHSDYLPEDGRIRLRGGSGRQWWSQLRGGGFGYPSRPSRRSTSSRRVRPPTRKDLYALGRTATRPSSFILPRAPRNDPSSSWIMRDRSSSYWFSVGDAVQVVQDVICGGRTTTKQNLKGRIGTVVETWEKCDVDPTCCCAEQVDINMAVRVVFRDHDRETTNDKDDEDEDDDSSNSNFNSNNSTDFYYYFAEDELDKL